MNKSQASDNNDAISKGSRNNSLSQNTLAKVEVDKIRSYLWWSVAGTIFIGVFMIALISIFGYLSVRDGINAFGSGVLIAGGSILSGGFMGFIFGIPGILQDPDARLKYNDNLIQISDWLTKIIVGVGLTQLYSIPHFVIKIGEHFQRNFGDQIWGRNVAIAIIGYFFVLGFIMIYFWTKTDYSTLMKAMDDDFNRKLRQEREAKEEAQQEKKETVQKLETAIEQKQQTEQKLETVQKDSETKSEDIQAVLQTFSSNANDIKETLHQFKASPGWPDDPQKGRWGGNVESNGRRVSAAVRQTSYDSEWFNINIEVTSTDMNKPLQGTVVFHLHPSFPNSTQTAPVENGSAKLQIVAYGAFTVGVECDNGQTKLELDLAELGDAPQVFRER